MVRHVFVVLLLTVCLVQVALSMPERKRRDAEEDGPSNILEGIEKLASDVSKKTQEFFSGDSLKAIQGNATELANKVNQAFEDLVEKARGVATSAPTAA